MPTVEVVMNKPLSGEEIRQIISSKLNDALSGDCRLADYIAVPAFRFRLDLAIVLNGAVYPNVDIVRTGGEGRIDENTAQAVTAHLEQHEMPPNEARVDAGLGVPVLTADEKGRPVERLVKYDKEKLPARTQAEEPAFRDAGPAGGMGTIHAPVVVPGSRG